MYLVVYGLRNAGLTGYLAGWLDGFARYGIWGAAMGTGVLAALLSSLMNNLPTVLIGLLSIEASHATQRGGEGGDDLCQRHRQRPGAENYSDWQSGDVVVVACAAAQEHPDWLGVITSRSGLC
jgi:hypothetical protein